MGHGTNIGAEGAAAFDETLTKEIHLVSMTEFTDAQAPELGPAASGAWATALLWVPSGVTLAEQLATLRAEQVVEAASQRAQAASGRPLGNRL